MASTMTTNTLIGNRYVLLETVGSGGMGIVHRALDKLSGQVVALKQVTTSSENLLFNSIATETHDVRVALAREFKTLASLRHPNIISVLDYGFDSERQPYFTMDWLENSQTILEAARGKPLNVQLDLIIQLVQALEYLHRRAVLHRDLKPANVLVLNGQTKVLDFGLATTEKETNDNATGTLGYMAPEVLTGDPSTEASDIYAVGVMAYEIFAGRHPFPLDNVTALIRRVIHEPIDVKSLGLPDAVSSMLERLLAKDPADRPRSATEIIAAYSAATSQNTPYETVATRESFLQAAKLVGRDTELQTLTTALRNMLDGKGSTWLLGGESGIGKSRLLDELRILALVEGAIVLRGQAVTEGEKAYQIWREPIRWPILLTDLNDLEAGVLKALVPDISNLLQRPVGDSVGIEGVAAQERLWAVINKLFREQQQPIVVLLEDLQWAGDESLDLFRRISRQIGSLRVLIIGSYRHDERVDLPKLLPEAKLLKLERLSEVNIADLSESMLGPGGREPEIVSLLTRETEGNIFFLIEVVRALAEQAGELHRVTDMALPEKVFAGGIQIAVKRRLDRVPDVFLPLLRLAAISGRQLDLKVLHAALPEVDIDRWATVCSDAAVLDVQDGAWRFAHDKLREGLLDDLSDNETKTLHRIIATNIHTVYGDSPDQLTKLAFHWAMAGDQDKEAQYSALAGAEMLATSAYSPAIKLLVRAIELKRGDTPHMARLEQMLGAAYYGRGMIEVSDLHSLRSLALLGWTMPDNNKRQQAVLLIGQMVEQILHRLLPSLYIGRDAKRRDLFMLAAQTCQLLSTTKYLAQDVLSVLLYNFYAINLDERAGFSAQLMRSYVNVGMAMSLVPLHSVAQMYITRSLEVANKIDAANTALQAFCWIKVVSALYHVGIGKWDRAERDCITAEQYNNKIGDPRVFYPIYSIGHGINFYRSRYSAAIEYAQKLTKIGSQYSDLQSMLLGRVVTIAVYIRLGNFDDAARLLNETKSLPEAQAASGVDRNMVGAAEVIVLWYQGNQEQALKRFSEFAPDFYKTRPTRLPSIISYSLLLIILFDAWEAGSAPAKDMALSLLAPVQRVFKLYPILHSLILRSQGLQDWMEGNQAAAQKKWQQSLDAAHEIGQPFDEAMAYYDMGRHLPASDPKRTEYLNRAVTLYNQVGASNYEQRATQALKG